MTSSEDHHQGQPRSHDSPGGSGGRRLLLFGGIWAIAFVLALAGFLVARGRSDTDIDQPADAATSSDTTGETEPLEDDAPEDDVIEDVAAVATIQFDSGSGASVAISQEEVDQIAGSVLGSPAFLGVAYAFDASDDDIRADVLTRLVYLRVIDKLLEDRGIDPTSVSPDAARDGFETQLVTAFETEQDPVAFASEVSEQIDPFLMSLSSLTARQARLTTELQADSVAVETVEVPCSRHILVDATDEQLANDLIAQLNGGADFAELAREFSTGPSGPSGGELGCTDPSAYVPEFRDAIVGAPVGEILGPVETQFGLHIIEVTELAEQDLGLTDPDQLALDAIQQELGAAVIVVSPESGLAWDEGSQAFVAAG